jgi:hypothetical protein
MNAPTTRSEPARVPVEPPADNGTAGRTADRSRTFTGAELAFLIGVPLAWAVLLLFHPGGDGKDVYLDLRDEVTPWLVVHIGQMVFIPLMVLAFELLLRGVPGAAARVSRIAIIVYGVFYTAFELLQGIGNGILVNAVNGLPQSEQATGAGLVQDYAENVLIRDFGVFVSIGSLALVTAAIAAGIALYREAGAPASVAVLLVLAAFLITAHPPPYGPTGLAIFVVAVLLFRRSQSSRQRRSAVRARPDPAS